MQRKERDPTRQLREPTPSLTEEEVADAGRAAGAYIFLPRWDDPLPHQYGKAEHDVLFQKGSLVDQWTITYDDSNGGPPVAGRYEQAIVKVRFSETFREIIEFEVELNPVPVSHDEQGKEVIVTWKMYGGF